MVFDVKRSENFKKQFKKLSFQDQSIVEKALTMMSTDLRHPSLRTKPIQGRKGLFESSANMSIRIIWRYDENKNAVILLLHIGKHDILKRY
jgi:mRNA-degrading endonuclease YafQ of YafQ-DinJ toxin-antitoxin module